MPKNLQQLSKGEKVDHFLLIKKLESKKTKTGSEYLDIELSDNSASVNAKFWNNFEDFKSYAEAGTVVKVSGVVEEFNGNKQIKILSARAATEDDNVSIDDFVPKSKRDPDEMIAELKSRIEKIENDYLKRLLKLILVGKRFEKYTRVPAGKAWHHSYIHGLLEHTLEIIKICDLMCNIHPEVNRDLLISGAILHDFGKTEELSAGLTFDYTTKGKLLGHIVIAAMEIEKEAKKIEWFPEDLKDQLIHLVLSHQGKLEFASPVVPRTLEAIILYHADELSAKTNAYKNAIEKDASDGEWTGFIRLAGTELLKEKISNEPDEDPENIHSLFD
ncbi:MAG: HD domain-containing protein [Ignavibacteria bacterium]|nr:MAG: HD domain-containing protein [Ignavibacteria bacterium]